MKISQMFFQILKVFTLRPVFWIIIEEAKVFAIGLSPIGDLCFLVYELSKDLKYVKLKPHRYNGAILRQ